MLTGIELFLVLGAQKVLGIFCCTPGVARRQAFIQHPSLTVQSMASPPASRGRFGKLSAEPSSAEPCRFEEPTRPSSARIDARAHGDSPGTGMQNRGNLPRVVQGGAKGGDG